MSGELRHCVQSWRDSTGRRSPSRALSVSRPPCFTAADIFTVTARARITVRTLESLIIGEKHAKKLRRSTFAHKTLTMWNPTPNPQTPPRQNPASDYTSILAGYDSGARFKSLSSAASLPSASPCFASAFLSLLPARVVNHANLRTTTMTKLTILSTRFLGEVSRSGHTHS